MRQSLCDTFTNTLYPFFTIEISVSRAAAAVAAAEDEEYALGDQQ